MNALERALQWLRGIDTRRPGFSRVLRIAGLVVIVVGLQAWAFDSRVVALGDVAGTKLALLEQEVTSNRLINTAMTGLRDYYRITDDELHRRQILELRETLTERYPRDPRAAIDDAVRITAGFEARSGTEQETMARARRIFGVLQDVYADHYAAALDAHTSPSWYLQPGAALFRSRTGNGDSLRFDRALYLLLVGDRAGANAILDELRQGRHTAAFAAGVLLAKARLQYDAFRIEQDPEYLRQAQEHTRASLRRDPDHELPKLLLEYLLAIDPQAVQTGETSMQGQGTGESEGERGAISDRPSEF